MKTKEQKKQELEYDLNRIDSSRTILFTDYTKVSSPQVNKLKVQLRELDSEYRVLRKRILRVAFKEKNIEVNPEDYEGQLAVIFSPKELIDIAGVVAKFTKEEGNFKILGGYDVPAGEMLSLNYINQISNLPPREVLLGQLVSMVATPIKMFMLILKERAKKLEGAA